MIQLFFTSLSDNKVADVTSLNFKMTWPYIGQHIVHTTDSENRHKYSHASHRHLNIPPWKLSGFKFRGVTELLVCFTQNSSTVISDSVLQRVWFNTRFCHASWVDTVPYDSWLTPLNRCWSVTVNNLLRHNDSCICIDSSSLMHVHIKSGWSTHKWHLELLYELFSQRDMKLKVFSQHYLKPPRIDKQISSLWDARATQSGTRSRSTLTVL